MSDVLAAHLTAGGGASFLTLTLRHRASDWLADTRRLAADGWRRVQQGRGWLTLKQAVGIAGTIRALEITHGANGWHPHIHALVLTERPLTAVEQEGLRAHAFGAWKSAVVAAGHRAPLAEHTTVTAVRDTEIAGYCTKLGAALELTHGAGKKAHGGSRTPFEILADFLNTGDADDLELWKEWEAGITGARQLTWTRGLKDRYAVEEVSDETLAAEEVGGATVAVITADEWRVVQRVPEMRVRLLEAAERGGAVAVDALLTGRIRSRADASG